MNEHSGAIALAIGGFLLSVWLFDGFWPTAIITVVGALVGAGIDENRRKPK
jgi:hypothetical protein